MDSIPNEISPSKDIEPKSISFTPSASKSSTHFLSEGTRWLSSLVHNEDPHSLSNFGSPTGKTNHPFPPPIPMKEHLLGSPAESWRLSETSDIVTSNETIERETEEEKLVNEFLATKDSQPPPSLLRHFARRAESLEGSQVCLLLLRSAEATHWPTQLVCFTFKEVNSREVSWH